ncbi:MAG: dipeptidase [Phycisphaerales bacterium]|nr:dipeptidase [Phycisphaerales bacterium]
MTREWFDAHLDLACLAETGRDMTAPLESCGGPPDPAVTFGSLARGRVTRCLATVFTEPGGTDAVSYPPGDVQAAHAAGVRQIDRYHAWARAGLISLGLSASAAAPPAFQAGILVEGADPIRDLAELGWWIERGVVAVGLTWARPSRYAGGNMTPELGLTDLGRALIDRIDAAGIVHDLSHLSDLAMDELLGRARGRVMASHSNCRTLMDGVNQRHLRDESIRAIAQRGGVIGLNLFGKFLDPSGEGRATLDHAVNHVEHICNLVGHARAVGLGSDMDGGFGAAAMPIGIRQPADLERISQKLSERGWSDDDIEAFSSGNWRRFWGCVAAG